VDNFLGDKKELFLKTAKLTADELLGDVNRHLKKLKLEEDIKQAA
jgi:hypothetical protein